MPDQEAGWKMPLVRRLRMALRRRASRASGLPCGLMGHLQPGVWDISYAGVNKRSVEEEGAFMMDFDIPMWSVLLAIFLRLYLSVVFWTFPIAAVLTAVNWQNENRRKRKSFLAWAVIAGIPWVAQPVFWAIGISKHGEAWLLGLS